MVDISLQGTVIVLVSKCKQTFRYKIELQKGFQRLEQVLEGNICMDKNSPSYILLGEDPPKFSKFGRPLHIKNHRICRENKSSKSIAINYVAISYENFFF